MVLMIGLDENNWLYKIGLELLNTESDFSNKAEWNGIVTNPSGF